MSPTHSGEPELKKRKTSGPASANSGRPAGKNFDISPFLSDSKKEEWTATHNLGIIDMEKIAFSNTRV
jgi:hypothetical protein